MTEEQEGKVTPELVEEKLKKYVEENDIDHAVLITLYEHQKFNTGNDTQKKVMERINQFAKIPVKMDDVSISFKSLHAQGFIGTH